MVYINLRCIINPLQRFKVKQYALTLAIQTNMTPPQIILSIVVAKLKG
jgi:hypothetical protein